jgi:hypothetical protein
MSVNEGEYKKFPFLQQVQPLLGVTDENRTRSNGYSARF